MLRKIIIGLLLLIIICIGFGYRYHSFKKNGLWFWNSELPCLVYIGEHLIDKGLYTCDFRVFPAFHAWFGNSTEKAKGDYLKYSFHRDENFLSKFGKSAQYVKQFTSDPGIALIFFLAFKIFGKEGPLLSIWKLQFVVDIIIIFLIYRLTVPLFGSFTGLVASFFYAVFPFIYHPLSPPYFPSQIPWHYFWMIPFVTITLFFWTHLLRTEEQKSASQCGRNVLFIGYGFFVGIFSLIRSNVMMILLFMGFLYFLYLLVIRKKGLKRFLLAWLLGIVAQVLVMSLISYYNYTAIGTTKFTSRYVWSVIATGIGFYKNPYGLIFNETVAERIAEEKHGIKGFVVSTPKKLQELLDFEKAMKEETLYMFKENPTLFVKSALKNFYYGFFLAPKLPKQTGRVSLHDFNNYRLPFRAYSFLYLSFLFNVLFCSFKFNKNLFWAILLILSVGIYLLLSVCLFAPPVAYYIFGYYPIFYILLAASIVNIIKLVVKNFPLLTQSNTDLNRITLNKKGSNCPTDL